MVPGMSLHFTDVTYARKLGNWKKEYFWLYKEFIHSAPTVYQVLFVKHYNDIIQEKWNVRVSTTMGKHMLKGGAYKKNLVDKEVIDSLKKKISPLGQVR